MDHKQAVDLHAAEKYMLGELPESQLLEYEEHYFDCAECALDLQAAAAFVEASRKVFREGAASALAAKPASREAAARPTWLQQFRGAFAAVPAFAALVLVVVVGYQNAVTIPRLKATSTQALATSDSRIFDLGASGARRGDEAPIALQIRPDQPFSVAFDFTPSASAPAYVCQLQDASGRVLLQLAVPLEKVNQRYVVSVPGSLLDVPGKYRIVMLGADPKSGLPATGSDVQHFVFTLAIQQ